MFFFACAEYVQPAEAVAPSTMFVPENSLVYIFLVQERCSDKNSMLGRGELVRKCWRLYLWRAGGSHVGCWQALPHEDAAVVVFLGWCFLFENGCVWHNYLPC